MLCSKSYSYKQACAGPKKAESPFVHHIPALLPGLVDILDFSGSESQNASVEEVCSFFCAIILVLFVWELVIASMNFICCKVSTCI